ncbi:hypothetical protein FRC09_010332 [Ceratobasidium sp. 395]|nr:hypothetical protein FRC09_010332 [Ceratobasidium sp. 395]
MASESGNELSGSSYNDRIQGPHVLDFPEMGDGTDPWWGYLNWPCARSGSTAEWYLSQLSTTFTRIQHRKERVGPFFHEFILIELDNDTVCRFDRRGDPTTLANALKGESMTAEDTAHVIQRHDSHYGQINKTSDLLLQINLSGSINLGVILRACCSIRRGETKWSYTPLEHNYYFFTWTILAAILCHSTGWHKRRMAICKPPNLPVTEMKDGVSSLRSRLMAHASAASQAPIIGCPWRPLHLLVAMDSPDRDDEASDVYFYIVNQIRKQCEYLRTFGVFLSPEKFEDAVYAGLSPSLKFCS